MCIICGNRDARQVTCNGCEQTFCLTHLIDHQNSIDEQMRDLKRNHQGLKQMQNNEDDYQEYFQRIDQWEKESIGKIQINADLAKAKLRKLIQQSNEYFHTSIQEIDEEIKKSEEMKNFSEIEIKQWKQRLNNLQLELQERFRIQFKESNEVPLIKIKQKRKHVLDEHEQTNKRIRNDSNDQFDQILGNAKFYENDRLVESDCQTRSIISGKNFYSNGKHSLHFQIEDIYIARWTCFFGLMTSNEVMKSFIEETNSVYGIWSNGYLVKNSTRSGRSGRRRWLKDDCVTITIDCENQQIHFENKRIHWNQILQINLHLCPLPWKILTIIKGCRLRLIESS